MLVGADGEPEVACIVVAALFVGNSVIVVVLKLDSCSACCFHTVCLHTVCLHTVCFHCNSVSSQYYEQGWQKAGFHSYCPGRRLLPALTGFYWLLPAFTGFK